MQAKMASNLQKLANLVAANTLHKQAKALPGAYQALLGLGTAGVVGGGSYLLTGLADKEGKRRLARAIGSAILGTAAGAGALYAGNKWVDDQWKTPMNVMGFKLYPREMEVGGLKAADKPFLGLGPTDPRADEAMAAAYEAAKAAKVKMDQSGVAF